MKAKYIFIALGTALLSACNMDLRPEGLLEDSNAIQSLDDVYSFRNGFYANFRGITTSQYFPISDIQCDYFNGLKINGNQMGAMANGNIVPNESTISGYWSAIYSVIANVNYFLEKSQPVYDNILESGNERQISQIERYIGEARFIRAYCYCMLFDRWCQQYTPDKADTPALGLPIVTVFDPSPDRGSYPSRSTMAKTINFINDDLNFALEAIQQYEQNGAPVSNDDSPSVLLAPMSPYISSYSIIAMKARLALWLGDNENANKYAKQVIDSGIYTLATVQNYAMMWEDDNSNEIILRPFMSKAEAGSSIGGNWIRPDVDDAWYIPASNIIADYRIGENNRYGVPDIRYSVFIEERGLSVEGSTVNTPCFIKFPGNPALNNGSTNSLLNMPKPFRLSEMYLIAAETAALSDEDEANTMLQTLRKNRYKFGNLAKESYTGTELIEQIRSERTKELIGEGFRLSDLRRWGLGFNRANGCSYTNSTVNDILTPTGKTVVYTPNDHRYTWPIPTNELQSNPQMANQQNPGY